MNVEIVFAFMPLLRFVFLPFVVFIFFLLLFSFFIFISMILLWMWVIVCVCVCFFIRSSFLFGFICCCRCRCHCCCWQPSQATAVFRILSFIVIVSVGRCRCRCRHRVTRKENIIERNMIWFLCWVLADEFVCANVCLCVFLFSYKSKSLGELNGKSLNEIFVCGIDSDSSSSSNRSGWMFEVTFELVDIIFVIGLLLVRTC